VGLDNPRRQKGAPASAPACVKRTLSLEPLEPRVLLSADLTATVSAIAPPAQVVPGYRVAFSVLVTNQGDRPAVGRMDIHLYASADATLDKTPGSTDVPVAALAQQAVSLGPGMSRAYTVSLVIPADAPPGSYFVLADIDPGQAIPGDDPSNNVAATSAPIALAHRFGTFAGRTGVRLTATDADGSVVTFALSGAGFGELVADNGRLDVVLTGTDAASALTIAVKGGDGQCTLGAIRGTQGTEALRGISAKAVNLAGEGIDLGGFLGAVAVRDLVNGADVLAGGVPAQRSSIVAREIGDGTTIDIGSSLASLSAARIGLADIFAPNIASIATRGDKTLGVAGDFAADVTVSGEGVAAGKPALGKVSLSGTFRDGLVLVNGAVGSVKAAALAADVPGLFFGISATAVKSVASANPAFAWAPSGGADLAWGDFHVIVSPQPGAWPLKDAAWELDSPGAAQIVGWQDFQGNALQALAQAGEVQIAVNPWKTSLARMEKIVEAREGALFALLPATGLYWAKVTPGQEAAFISALAGLVTSASPNLLTAPQELTIPTNWSAVDSAVIPGLSGMETGNIVLEAAGKPMAVSWDQNGKPLTYFLLTSDGRLDTNPDGSFKETSNPALGATHADVVNYYRTNGYELYQSNPAITAANSTVAIPSILVDGEARTTAVCDIASIAAVIQRAAELGQPATINLSWGNGEYTPEEWARDNPPPAPADGWKTYNQSLAEVYRSQIVAILESGVRGAADALIIHAAGNGSTDLSSVLANGLNLHPGAARQIIEVGALDASGNIADYSNYSTVAGSILYVPVPAATPGTSFAAPQVQYLVSQIRASRPDLTLDQIRQILFHPDVAPLRNVPRPGAPGQQIVVPVIENPCDPDVLQAALDVANAIAPPAGFTVAPTTGLVTTEAGGKATFTVALNSQPTANVTVSFASSDPTEGLAPKKALVFTPLNWNLPQTVTVTGVDDRLIDGDQPYTIVLLPAVSADPVYNGLDPADVALVNRDNEQGNLAISLDPPIIEVTYQDQYWVDYAVRFSGTASGPVLSLFGFGENYVVWDFTMNGWTGKGEAGAGPFYREQGDPASTRFSFHTEHHLRRTALPQVVTVEVSLNYFDLDTFELVESVKASATVTLS